MADRHRQRELRGALDLRSPHGGAIASFCWSGGPSAEVVGVLCVNVHPQRSRQSFQKSAWSFEWWRQLQVLEGHFCYHGVVLTRLHWVEIHSVEDLLGPKRLKPSGRHTGSGMMRRGLQAIHHFPRQQGSTGRRVPSCLDGVSESELDSSKFCSCEASGLRVIRA